jgi:hypothetical protein
MRGDLSEALNRSINENAAGHEPAAFFFEECRFLLMKDHGRERRDIGLQHHQHAHQ